MYLDQNTAVVTFFTHFRFSKNEFEACRIYFDHNLKPVFFKFDDNLVNQDCS